MKTADLAAELCAAQSALTNKQCATLHGVGIPELMISLGFVGAVRIDLDGGGRRYQPLEDGAPAFVTPVRIGEAAASPESPAFELVPQYGGLIDLVAWSPQYPARWALRCGLASWLGSIPPQYCLPAPVQIRRSPLSWLRTGAQGLCILSRGRLDAYRVLSLCCALEAEDAMHARELRSILERPFKTPTISVAPFVRAAA